MKKEILNKKVKVKDFRDLFETTVKLLDKNKLYNIVIKEVNMENKIWTKKQQEYLDKRFGKLEAAVEKNTKAIAGLSNKFEDLSNKFEDLSNKFEDLSNKFKDLSNKFDILIDRLEKNNTI